MSNENHTTAGPDDELHHRFREALSRKKPNGGPHGPGGRAGGKVRAGHDAETTATQQMFRRMSGS